MSIKDSRIIATVAIVALIVASGTGVFMSSPKLYLETTTGRYRVVEAKFSSGSNHLFTVNTPARMWWKRQMLKVGINVAGRTRPDGPMWGGQKMNVISILCEASGNAGSEALIAARSREINEGISGMEAECVDDAGNVIRLKHVLTPFGTEQIVWFVWHFSDEEIAGLHRMGLSDVVITNFCPRQLRLIRKSDRAVLTRLELAR